LVGPSPLDRREAQARLRVFIEEGPERMATPKAFLCDTRIRFGFGDAVLIVINMF
jgi:hypothetical protein